MLRYPGLFILGLYMLDPRKLDFYVWWSLAALFAFWTEYVHDCAKEDHRHKERNRNSRGDYDSEFLEVDVLPSKEHEPRPKRCQRSAEYTCSHFRVGLLHPRLSIISSAMHISS